MVRERERGSERGKLLTLLLGEGYVVLIAQFFHFFCKCENEDKQSH
jgi:hypothetical protein